MSMTTEDKIEWLIDYEGCELADAYGGLELFFQYAAEDKDVTKILDAISDEVDRQYRITKEVLDEQDDYEDDRVIDVVNDLWNDLSSRGLLHSPRESHEKEVKEKWANKLKDLI